MGRRLLLALVCALVLAPAAMAATTTPTAPVFDAKSHLIETPFAPTAPTAQLTKHQALAILRSYPKVHAWLARYPAKGLTDEEDYDSPTRSWTVKIWWGKAGEIAEGKVDDQTGTVTEAWTGPQVAWGMARGVKGAFGGTKINTPWVWGAFCLVFL
ncbi:MAG: hypothetical protein ACRDL2_12770, partial [Gaiellaceae bacterium]